LSQHARRVVPILAIALALGSCAAPASEPAATRVPGTPIPSAIATLRASATSTITPTPTMRPTLTLTPLLNPTPVVQWTAAEKAAFVALVAGEILLDPKFQANFPCPPQDIPSSADADPLVMEYLPEVCQLSPGTGPSMIGQTGPLNHRGGGKVSC